MPEKKCSYCFTVLDGRATICSSCGKKVGKANKNGIAAKSWPFWQNAIAVLVVLWLIGIFIQTNEKINGSGGEAQKQTAVSPQVPLYGKAKLIKQKHPDWSNEVCKAVAQRAIIMGMTAQQVHAAIGKPDNINATVTGYGKNEQWVYGQNFYVYLDNGKVTSWQNDR